MNAQNKFGSFQPSIGLKNVSLDSVSKLPLNKLPSNLQVLERLLGINCIDPRSSVQDRIKSIITEVQIIWKSASLPTRQEVKCQQKLNNLYTEYIGYKKFGDRLIIVRGKNKDKFDEFINNLWEVFDICQHDFHKSMDDQEIKKLFLKSVSQIRTFVRSHEFASKNVCYIEYNNSWVKK